MFSFHCSACQVAPMKISLMLLEMEVTKIPDHTPSQDKSNPQLPYATECNTTVLNLMLKLLGNGSLMPAWTQVTANIYQCSGLVDPHLLMNFGIP